MKWLMKVFSAFIFACVLSASIAGICGCKREHEHDWSDAYEVIGDDKHAKICTGCGAYKDEHTAVWSDDNDTLCNHGACDVTRTIKPAETISVTAPSDTVVKGGTLQLTASEEGVTWSIASGTVGVSISVDGLLTVSAETDATSVVVTASKENFISGTKTITLTEAVSPSPDGLNTFDTGIYADETFNLLEIKSPTAVSVNGEDYALGTIEGGKATLTCGSRTGYIEKVKINDGFIYAVEIQGIVSGDFALFSDYSPSISDFVGIYAASNAIIASDGGTYYKYCRFIFLADGTLIVSRVEVENASGTAKLGAQEVSFKVKSDGHGVRHNILNFDGGWRAVALDKEAQSVAFVYSVGGKAVRKDYAKTDGKVPQPANLLPIDEGERFVGENLTIYSDTVGKYRLGNDGTVLNAICGNPTDGYLVAAESGENHAGLVNYILKFLTSDGAKRIEVYKPDGETPIDLLYAEGGDAPDREYEEMTDGFISLTFPSAGTRYVKTVVPTAGEYVVSAESADYFGDGGVSFSICGTQYGYVTDGQNWTVAQSGAVFENNLWENAEVKIEVTCPSAQLGAVLGEVELRIETKAEYERRKAEENAPPVFGQERSGTYYGACGGKIAEIVLGEQGVTYKGVQLTFVRKKKGVYTYRSDDGYFSFTFGQDGTLSVTDGAASARYTAYKEVEWQGFSADKQGAYSFLGNIDLAGVTVSTSITMTIGAQSLEYRLTRSDGIRGEVSQSVLIGLKNGVYTFLNGHGETITFAFGEDIITVSADGFQPLIDEYVAVKDRGEPIEPAYLTVDADNAIGESGEYFILSETAVKVMFIFDENRMTVNVVDAVIHNGDTVGVEAGTPLKVDIIITGEAGGATLRVEAHDEDEGNASTVEDYGYLAVGKNTVDFGDSEAVTVYLDGVPIDTYKISFYNAAQVTVNNKPITVNEKNSAEITVDLRVDGYAEFAVTRLSAELPVKIVVKKIG